MNYTQCGSALALPYADGIAQTCVTSPPYYGLRRYLQEGDPNAALEVGTEQTPAAYVAQIVAAMREVKRVLRDDGTLWLNLGSSFSTSKIMSQYSRMRLDLTDEEKRYVAMEMFGVRFGDNEASGKGALLQVLPQGDDGAALRGEPGLEGQAIAQELPNPQRIPAGHDEGEATPVEMDGHREVGRGLRVLRGDDTGVPYGGSHQGGRGRTSKSRNGKFQSQQPKDIQGHQEPGISEGQVSSPLYELQLLKRVLGILSTHTFTDDQLPDSVRFAFAKQEAFKPKDLIDIPSMVAEALRNDGWYLRSDIIWAKPNPMPESVTDRPTKAHEYVFLLAKQPRYFYDAEAIKENTDAPPDVRLRLSTFAKAGESGSHHNGNPVVTTIGRNARSVWQIATQPYSGAHFATMPPELARRCILAGTSARGQCPKCGAPWARVVEKGLTAHDGETESAYEKGTTANRLAKLRQAARERGEEYTNGKVTTGWEPTCACDAGDPIPQIVLDPFMGSGTTAMVALQNGRQAIGTELNPAYLRLQDDRTQVTIGLGL